MATSASPVVTAANVPFTSTPRVTLVSGMLTPAVCRIWAAYLPHGTVRPHRDTTSAWFRSASVLMPFGFPGFVTISSLFFANTVGVPSIRLALTSLFMLSSSADANVSTPAPELCWICVSSVPDDPKLNVVPAFGFAVLKSAPILVNASVNDAAADTVMVPVTLDTVVVVVDLSLLPDFEPLLHPAATSPTIMTTTSQRFIDVRTG